MVGTQTSVSEALAPSYTFLSKDDSPTMVTAEKPQTSNLRSSALSFKRFTPRAEPRSVASARVAVPCDSCSSVCLSTHVLTSGVSHT